MIARALAYCCAACLAYSGMLALVPDRLIRRGASDQQVNYVRAEQVLYANHCRENVIVGSSIAGTLRAEQLGEGFGLLAFGGGCGATGLELLARVHQYPKRVFVESNVLVKKTDLEMLDYFTSVPFGHLRRWVPLLRQSNQPGNLLMALLQHFKAPPERTANPDQLAIGLGHFSKLYAKVPETNQWASGLGNVTETLRRLQASGVEVVLVEFPVDNQLRDTPHETFVRSQLKAAFPETKFRWLHLPEGTKWQTTDGVHMTSDSARRFATLLKNFARGPGPAQSE